MTTGGGSGADAPWYRRALRWAQTNLVEIDPERYDDQWWRAHWRKTRVQGAIINAGGIVAYYPSEVELHYRAKTLGDTDLFGKIVESARSEGLAVVARMDSNRVSEEFYRVHPDWICVDRDGTPYRRAEKYVTCINSPYYWDYLPRILREIIQRTGPDGFADNSWAGLPRSEICYCRHCREKFSDLHRIDLPIAHDWSNEAFRQWVRWNYDRRVDLWKHNNTVTAKHGGQHCQWMGMLSGDLIAVCERFVDLERILAESEIVMLDHQRRNAFDGFAQNTEVGKRLHELLGWDKLIPESTPQYQLGYPAFRLSSMPPAEVRLWSSAGFAGGIQPWWHHIGSCHDDRRQYQTAEPIFQWHEANQDILVQRAPIADVGVVWSQTNHDFHGRDDAANRTLMPYRGVVQALDRAGTPYLPVHADRLAGAADRFRVLVLPNLAAMSDAQLSEIRAFAELGGSLIVTSETSAYDENGDPRAELGLGDLFGVKLTDARIGGIPARTPSMETGFRHSYLRLTPPLRGECYGPNDPDLEKSVSAERHAIFKGLDGTDTLPFGGYLPVFKVDDETTVISTYIPDFPIFPPETSYMGESSTDIPAIAARMGPNGSKLIWFFADVDRCYARDGSFEHAMLLTNAVDEVLGQPLVALEGTYGQISATPYRQGDRIVLHLNNRLIAGKGPGRQETIIPIGPVKVEVGASDDGFKEQQVELRVANISVQAHAKAGRLSFEVPSISDHEVVIIRSAN